MSSAMDPPSSQGGVRLMRDGVPLPAVTAAQAVSQLAHRVIGPGGRDLAPVLDWAAGGDPAEITTRYRLPPTALQRRLRILRLAGSVTPLRPSVLAELSAPDARSEQHRRARRLFAIRTPRGYLQMQVARSTDVALRVLATLGPQPIEILVDAANRSRQPTAKLPPVIAADLELGLRHRGATHDPDTGRWTAPAGTTPAERDVQLVDALRTAGPLTRVQLRQVLIAVGYTSHSPQTTIVDRHPLIRRVALNSYELLTRPAPAPHHAAGCRAAGDVGT